MSFFAAFVVFWSGLFNHHHYLISSSNQLIINQKSKILYIFFLLFCMAFIYFSILSLFLLPIFINQFLGEWKCVTMPSIHMLIKLLKWILTINILSLSHFYHTSNIILYNLALPYHQIPCLLYSPLCFVYNIINNDNTHHLFLLYQHKHFFQ